MTIQYAASIRTAQSTAIETDIGTAPILRIRTGAQPANVAAASSGSVLATVTLPSDWASHTSGVLSGVGLPWADTAADASGTAAHFEIVASDGTTRKMQGSVSVSGGGGDMIVDSVSFTAGQQFSVTAFAITMGNA